MRQRWTDGFIPIPLVNAETGKWDTFHLAGSPPPFLALAHSMAPRLDHELSTPTAYTTMPVVAPDMHSVIEVARQKAIEHGIRWILPVSTLQYSNNEARRDFWRSGENPNNRQIPPVLQWYGKAEWCMVYLHDLDTATSPLPTDAWRACAWFHDAWAMPALLGSRLLCFYDSNWTEIPAITTRLISNLTKIPTQFLLAPPTLPAIPVARIFHWASQFSSRSAEEHTHAVMSICTPKITICKGHGSESFLAFQIQLFWAQLRDLSILAWESEDAEALHGVLAESLSSFSGAGRFWDEEEDLALTVRDGRLCGGKLDVDAFCCHFENDVLMEVYCKRGHLDSTSHRAGLVVRLKEDKGAYVRVRPYRVEASPPDAIFVRERIRLRLVGIDRNPFARKKPENGAQSREETPQPSFLPLHPPTGPTTCSPSMLESWKPSDILSRRPKRSVFDMENDDGDLDARAYPEHDPHEAKRGRLEWEAVLGSRLSPVSRNRELPQRKDLEYSTSSEDETAEEGEMEDPDQDGETEEVSDEDFAIFHDVPTDDDGLDPSHPFYITVQTVFDRVWDEFHKVEGYTKGRSWSPARAPGVQSSKGTSESADGITSENPPAAPQQSLQGQKSTKTPKVKMFACPYYSFDRVRFRACLEKGGFRDVRAVKSHLALHHRRAIRCPTCQQPFGSQETFMQHVKHEKCKKRDRVEDLGISEDHLPKLYQRLPDSTEEERWYFMYKTLLPSPKTQDQSGCHQVHPYLTGAREEVLVRLQDFWEKKGTIIVSDVVRKMGLLQWQVQDEERGLKQLHGSVTSQLYRTVAAEFPVW